VQDFLRLVHAFMTSGTCSANPGETIPRKRQSPSLLQPDSTFMATKLAPLLYDYARSGINSQYIQPFQKTWDDERNVNGGFLPTFGELASGVSDYNPVDGDAIVYLGGSDIDGEQCFVCRDRRTGLDPWTTVAPTSLQEELVLEVVQTIRRWGGEWESV
jgi:hypothetical protein